MSCGTSDKGHDRVDDSSALVGMCHDHIVEFYHILHHTASREPLCTSFYKD